MKELFNFYLDNELKEKLFVKLEQIYGKQAKGQLAALIRVLLAQFNATPVDKINPLLLQAVEAEYMYTLKKGKRSSL